MSRTLARALPGWRMAVPVEEEAVPGPQQYVNHGLLGYSWWLWPILLLLSSRVQVRILFLDPALRPIRLNADLLPTFDLPD